MNRFQLHVNWNLNIVFILLVICRENLQIFWKKFLNLGIFKQKHREYCVGHVLHVGKHLIIITANTQNESVFFFCSGDLSMNAHCILTHSLAISSHPYFFLRKLSLRTVTKNITFTSTDKQFIVNLSRKTCHATSWLRTEWNTYICTLFRFGLTRCWKQISFSYAISFEMVIERHWNGLDISWTLLIDKHLHSVFLHIFMKIKREETAHKFKHLLCCHWALI